MSYEPLTPEQQEVVKQSVMDVMRYLEDNGEHRTGGYFRYYSLDGSSQTPSLVLLNEFHVGELTPEQLERYKFYSEEKALRLARNSADHLTSMESRDPDANLWGGAVLTYGRHGILTFSGFPDKADEAAMWLAEVRLELMSFGDACCIARNVTRNETLFEVVARCVENGTL